MKNYWLDFEKPSVVSCVLERNKHFESFTGEPLVKCREYNADSLVISLSNGHKMETWIDDEGVRNYSWKHWDDPLALMFHEYDYEACEMFLNNI